ARVRRRDAEETDPPSRLRSPEVRTLLQEPTTVADPPAGLVSQGTESKVSSAPVHEPRVQRRRGRCSADHAGPTDDAAAKKDRAWSPSASSRTMSPPPDDDDDDEGEIRRTPPVVRKGRAEAEPGRAAPSRREQLPTVPVTAPPPGHGRRAVSGTESPHAWDDKTDEGQAKESHPHPARQAPLSPPGSEARKLRRAPGELQGAEALDWAAEAFARVNASPSTVLLKGFEGLSEAELAWPQPSRGRRSASPVQVAAVAGAVAAVAAVSAMSAAHAAGGADSSHDDHGSAAEGGGLGLQNGARPLRSRSPLPRSDKATSSTMGRAARGDSSLKDSHLGAELQAFGSRLSALETKLEAQLGGMETRFAKLRASLLSEISAAQRRETKDSLPLSETRVYSSFEGRLDEVSHASTELLRRLQTEADERFESLSASLRTQAAKHTAALAQCAKEQLCEADKELQILTEKGQAILRETASRTDERLKRRSSQLAKEQEEQHQVYQTKLEKLHQQQQQQIKQQRQQNPSYQQQHQEHEKQQQHEQQHTQSQPQQQQRQSPHRKQEQREEQTHEQHVPPLQRVVQPALGAHSPPSLVKSASKGSVVMDIEASPLTPRTPTSGPGTPRRALSPYLRTRDIHEGVSDGPRAPRSIFRMSDKYWEGPQVPLAMTPGELTPRSEWREEIVNIGTSVPPSPREPLAAASPEQRFAATLAQQEQNPRPLTELIFQLRNSLRGGVSNR
ncbi:unnamed protein product, partial [Polarella glacialis]